MDNGREKRGRSYFRKTQLLSTTTPFLTFSPSSQNPREHTGSAWKPGKNKHSGGEEEFSLGRRMGLVPAPPFPSSGGKFYPCFPLGKGTSAAAEHPSKAGDMSWDREPCRGQEPGRLVSWQHPFKGYKGDFSKQYPKRPVKGKRRALCSRTHDSNPERLKKHPPECRGSHPDDGSCWDAL